MAGPEKALEAAVRELGTDGARHTLAALPRALHLPVDLAIPAAEAERVLDWSQSWGGRRMGSFPGA